MSYRVGLFGASPTLICDACSGAMEIKPTRGGMPAWLAKGKAPRGWSTKRDGVNARIDICPRCRVEFKAIEVGK